MKGLTPSEWIVIGAAALFGLPLLWVAYGALLDHFTH